ncbi:DEAD/DEAH box helicase family protein [Seonamhaeicola sp. NFXS20]|uniref:DEAD/DEAH box helicase n=1 Tax=Seonamhaeicola sp. NFXS20 TaxID=2816959 RepID=UPI003B8AE9C1
MSESILTPKEVEAHFRDYQLSAVKKMKTYIDSFKAKETEGSALVAMPTGSGKTIVIAGLAACLKDVKGVLILSPRRPIVNQLFNEISNEIFNVKFTDLKKKPTKSVYDIDVTEDQIKENPIICWTIQKLNSVYNEREKNEIYNLLKKHIQLILFDEGHYEPAPKWSDAVRSFTVPRIIFSATPFRNDFKKFDIDWKNNVYKIGYQELIKRKYIRSINIHDIGSQNKIEHVIDNLLSRINSTKSSENNRLIIKCDNVESILKICKILKNKSIDFIAIHETFKNRFKDANKAIGKYLYQTVPKNQNERTEQIWIHQFKLIEGIDSSKFKYLAIIDPMTSTRSLVQQIGRIIRIPDDKEMLGEVFNYTEHNYKDEWNRFLEVDANGNLTQTLAYNIYNQIVDSLDESYYVDKKMRSTLTRTTFEDWRLEDLKENLLLPLKVNLISKISEFDFDSFKVNYLDKELEDKDHYIFKSIFGAKSLLYLYFTINNSPYLKESFFPELTHHICFVKEMKNFIFFYDSGKMLPVGRDDLGLRYGIDSNILKSIFKETGDTVVSRIALKNTNIGSSEPHSHSFMASSIEDTTGYLNDFSHFMSSTFGHYKDKKVYKEYKNPDLKNEEYQIRTYLGFGTGRVSQSEGKNVKFKEFLDWLDYLNSSLESQSDSTSVFNRYTTEITNESDDIPQSIMLDLFDIEISSDNFKIGNIEEEYIDEEKEIYQLNDTFYLIDFNDSKYQFNLKINDTNYPIIIKYDDNRKKFKLESDTLKGDIQLEDATTNQKVIQILKTINRKQCFRIITEKGLSYSGGRFYKPHFKFGKHFDETLSPLAYSIFSIDKLDELHSEKGTKNNDDGGWDENSLFNLIDQRGKGSDLEKHMLDVGEKEEFLLCTDMQTEPADFIWVTNKKIAFIHIKR